MTMPRIVVLLLILNTLVVLGGTAANYMMLRSLKGVHSTASADVAGEAVKEEEEVKEYGFFPIPKVIVTLKGKDREHYFVLDLVLQTDIKADQKKLAQIDPMVRSSVVANLSVMDYDTLRNMPIEELQRRLETAVIEDFSSKHLQRPFEHVLVSKLIVQ
ncbi:flagellar basal body-associated FliL family protein [Ectopseudomonas mendocina]|uniref:Flagellar protein FliL n=1 Tax=Ectopseudomonas mendocina TaxID=300 RepID=A0ABZ2RKA2_ECTME